MRTYWRRWRASRLVLVMEEPDADGVARWGGREALLVDVEIAPATPLEYGTPAGGGESRGWSPVTAAATWTEAAREAVWPETWDANEDEGGGGRDG